MCIFNLADGHKKYSSKKAKEKFADSLISLSDKAFALTVIPPSVWLIGKNPEVMSQQFGAACLIFSVTFYIGLLLRHAGLKIHDELNSTPNEPHEACQNFQPKKEEKS